MDRPIDFVDLLELIWAGRVKIAIAVAVLCAVAVITNFVMASIYSATELVQVRVSNDRTGSELSSLAGSLGGVASLAGAAFGLESNDARSVALATLKSRYIIEHFIDKYNLLPVLFASRWDSKTNRWSVTKQSRIPNDEDGYKVFTKKIFTVADDGTTGLIRVTVKWKNPREAAAWLQEIVRATNERLRDRDVTRYKADIDYLATTAQNVKVLPVQQALYSLMAEEYQKLMVAENPEDATFQVVDPVETPLRPEPRLLLFLLLGGTGGLVVGLLYVLLKNAIAGRRESRNWRDFRGQPTTPSQNSSERDHSTGEPA